MGYTRLTDDDARCWRPGDIVLLPAETGSRKHVRVQPTGASRLKISVGDTSRSDNSTELFTKIFTNQPEVPKTLIVVDVAGEPDHSFEEDNLFVPGGRMVTTHASLAAVDLGRLASQDETVRRREALNVAMAFGYRYDGSAELRKLIDDIATATGFDPESSPEHAYSSKYVEYNLYMFTNELFHLLGKSQKIDDPNDKIRDDFCDGGFPSLSQSDAFREASRKSMFATIVSPWLARHAFYGKKDILTLRASAVRELLYRHVTVWRPDMDAAKRFFNPVFGVIFNDVIRAYGAAAEIYEAAAKTTSLLKDATDKAFKLASGYNASLGQYDVEPAFQDTLLSIVLGMQRRAGANTATPEPAAPDTDEAPF